MEISDDLRCVFSGEIEERDGSYVVEVPKRELDLATLHAGEVYRVAMLAPDSKSSVSGSASRLGAAGDGETRETGTDADRAVGADGADAADEREVSDANAGATSSRTAGSRGSSGEPEPPVDRGDEVTVDIEGIGDQGDGIARVDRGYVIIVPDTEKGERVRIRVTSVKQNVAFAEVVDRVERHQYE
ncbi:TRAM domain-containing protein (plasmid) [Halobaculum sp. CBA1158]|uniref:TRAM domain-containing protein n=1 Tax=Halobaculum sp. CBA1158 TaxID=2904243 RepID=UPI001F28C774|nr:TRAM domain-containing protein [Halobaculum sp. CBA1158]UIP01406.1 TRAM domain-containing protein [Halobaculum sp. CBA1158]